MDDLTSRIEEYNSLMIPDYSMKKNESSDDSSEFMELMLTQLQNQNPLEPLKDSELLSQFATLNSVQELKSIKELLTTMTSANQLASSVAFIGKTVEYLDGETIKQGVVTSVTLDDDKTKLWIGNTEIDLEEVTRVKGG